MRPAAHAKVGAALNTETIDTQLIERAQRLSAIAQRLGLAELAPTILKDTHRRLKESRVRAVVVGEIKQGKSTLVNALMGRIVLPSGVTPTTGAPVLIRVGTPSGPHVERNGELQPIEQSAFEQRCRGLGDGNGAPQGDLVYLVEPGTLPSELEFVDTPGVNDMSHLRAAISQGELPRADILVLVLDATQLLNRTEMAFLRDAVAAVGGLEDSGAHLLLAVNRIDLIAERERPKLRDHLHRELAGLTGATHGEGAAASAFEVFFTDARTAAREPDAVTPGAQGAFELRRRLFEIASTRNEMLPARARASLLRYSALLSHHAAVAARASQAELSSVRGDLQAVQADLPAEIDMTAVRALMNDGRQRVRDASYQRIEVFRGKLQTTIEAIVESASHRTLSTHLASAIHDAFLGFASEEAQHLRADLDALSRKVIRTHSEQIQRRLAHATMRLGLRGPTVYIEPPSALLEAGLVAVGVAGTAVMYFGNMVAGLLMAIAGPLATVFLREKSIRDARQRARAQLPAALQGAAAGLQDQVRRVIDGHLAALDEYVLLGNLGLRTQLEGLLARVVAELATEDAEARTQLKAHVHEIELELEAIRGQLHDLPHERRA